MIESVECATCGRPVFMDGSEEVIALVRLEVKVYCCAQCSMGEQQLGGNHAE